MHRPLLILLCLILGPHLHAEEEDSVANNAGALQQRGVAHFFAGRIRDAVADWDRVIALAPGQGPHHWQRGIALYYAEEYELGVAQFESHQVVNGRDVENAVWHFLCVARAEDGSVAVARRKMFPFAGDIRVPMREVHQLFAGSAAPGDVLEAARAGAQPEALRNRLCYAHLYLGLYFEALGQDRKSAAHIRKAAVDYKMDHYMGRVARLHHRLRSDR